MYREREREAKTLCWETVREIASRFILSRSGDKKAKNHVFATFPIFTFSNMLWRHIYAYYK